MKRITASRLWLAAACGYAYADDLPWDDKPSSSARYGSAVHKYAERYVLAQKPDIDEIALEYSLAPAQIRDFRLAAPHLSKWLEEEVSPAPLALAEIKYAYDVTTGDTVILDQTDHRDYSQASPTAIVGTADLVMPPLVADYKTGAWVDHPSENLQMRFLALAVARAHDADDVTAAIVRVQKDGVSVLRHTFDALDLDATAADLVAIRRKVDDGKPEPGPHCKRCPARKTCSYVQKQEQQEAIAS